MSLIGTCKQDFAGIQTGSLRLGPRDSVSKESCINTTMYTKLKILNLQSGMDIRIKICA